MRALMVVAVSPRVKIMSGTSLQELMELGGWKSFEMVLRYSHLAPEQLSTATQRIERVWDVVEGQPYDFPTLTKSVTGA